MPGGPPQLGIRGWTFGQAGENDDGPACVPGGDSREGCAIRHWQPTVNIAAPGARPATYTARARRSPAPEICPLNFDRDRKSLFAQISGALFGGQI